jgi:hypothetical protein
MLGNDMTDILDPIARRLATFVRLLSSDKEGEIVAAARAIVRTLETKGADIHALAERVEGAAGGGLNEAEMKKLYDAGYQDGIRAADNRNDPVVSFHDTDGTPQWHEMARWCQRRSDRLRSKERDFVDQMTAETVWRDPTERQASWLKSIFYRLGGGREF